MENPNPNTCGVMEGSLPGKCASMAFPYIPMQGSSAERYDQSQALAAGTLSESAVFQGGQEQDELPQ